MRYVSIFSGVEAATLAWEPLGWEPVAFAEVDRFPSAVLAERWPDVPKRLSTATYAERSRSAGQLRASLSPIPMVVGDELHPDREMRVRWGGGKGALVSDEVSLTLSTSNLQTLFDDGGDGMTVRRLTPLECERLQGFPDNHTRIPWRGKPEEECPDGPRYKAIGNSMAVPVMRWIGERIKIYEKEEDNG